MRGCDIRNSSVSTQDISNDYGSRDVSGCVTAHEVANNLAPLRRIGNARRRYRIEVSA